MLRVYTLFRERMAVLAANECPFAGEVELDKSYFGANRVRGRRGRGGERTAGLRHPQARRPRAYPDRQKLFESNAPGNHSRPDRPLRDIHSDGWRAYDGLVEAGFAKHHRIRHQEDGFATKGVHINGIESFWSFAKRRLANSTACLLRASQSLLKETEFRFNHRHRDLYRTPIASIRKVSLGR